MFDVLSSSLYQISNPRWQIQDFPHFIFLAARDQLETVNMYYTFLEYSSEWEISTREYKPISIINNIIKAIDKRKCLLLRGHYFREDDWQKFWNTISPDSETVRYHICLLFPGNHKDIVLCTQASSTEVAPIFQKLASVGSRRALFTRYKANKYLHEKRSNNSCLGKRKQWGTAPVETIVGWMEFLISKELLRVNNGRPVLTANS